MGKFLSLKDECYSRLANAIVIQAAEDYRNYAELFCQIKHQGHFYEKLFSELVSLEKFFTESAWGEMIHRGTGNYIIENLHKEIYDEFGINISKVLQYETEKKEKAKYEINRGRFNNKMKGASNGKNKT